ncbi:MAG: 50S ribosomal protein L35 [bacterium]|nr:50S ribosomal protein L35 [bacterium]
MPKIKTHKATAKRFKITRNNKIIKRKAGQDHFNTRESGVTTRNKRRDLQIADTEYNVIRQLMPYNK